MGWLAETSVSRGGLCVSECQLLGWQSSGGHGGCLQTLLVSFDARCWPRWTFGTELACHHARLNPDTDQGAGRAKSVPVTVWHWVVEKEQTQANTPGQPGPPLADLAVGMDREQSPPHGRPKAPAGARPKATALVVLVTVNVGFVPCSDAAGIRGFLGL